MNRRDALKYAVAAAGLPALKLTVDDPKVEVAYPGKLTFKAKLDLVYEPYNPNPSVLDPVRIHMTRNNGSDEFGVHALWVVPRDTDLSRAFSHLWLEIAGKDHVIAAAGARRVEANGNHLMQVSVFADGQSVRADYYIKDDWLPKYFERARGQTDYATLTDLEKKYLPPEMIVATTWAPSTKKAR